MDIYNQELDAKTQLLRTDEDVANFYRLSVLKAINRLWIEVDALQQLKSVVSSRSIAQRDPMQEYHKEALISYETMRQNIKDQVVKILCFQWLILIKTGKLRFTICKFRFKLHALGRKI